MRLHQNKAPQTEDQTLHNAFSAATYGHYCRTSSFFKTPDEHWLEAIQVSPGQWNIYKVDVITVEDQTEVQRHTVEKVQTHEGVHFFQALTMLAEYERAYKDENNETTLALDTPETLGHEHYQAFGMREGIAFDCNTGMPLHTVNGLVTESASIDYETMRELRKAWQEKQLLFLTEAGALNPTFSLSVSSEDLDKLFVSIEDSQRIDEIYQHFDDLIGLFAKVVEKDADGTHVGKYESKSKHLKTIVEDNFEDMGVLHLRFQQYVALIDLYMALYLAKKSFEDFYKKGASAETVKRDVIERAQDIQQRYLALGGDPVGTEQIEADIIQFHRKTFAAKRDVPKAIETVQENLRAMKKAANDVKMHLKVVALGKKDAEEMRAREALRMHSGANFSKVLGNNRN